MQSRHVPYIPKRPAAARLPRRNLAGRAAYNTRELRRSPDQKDKLLDQGSDFRSGQPQYYESSDVDFCARCSATKA